MRNIIISMSERQINIDESEIGNSGNRVVENYRIIKNIGPRNCNSNNKVSTAIMMKSSLVYDVTNKEFIKNRYGQLGGVVTVTLPGYLNPLFNAIDSIVDDTSYNDLISTHRKSVLLEAIYLTDTIHKYPTVDKLDYQLTRYLYGRELPQNALKEIYEKYPEKLI